MIKLIIFATAGIMAASAAVLGFFTAMRLTHTKTEDGIFKYAFYAIVISLCAITLSAGRDLSAGYSADNFKLADLGSNFLTQWIVRLSSLMIMFAAFERFLHFFTQPQINFSKLYLALILMYGWVVSFYIPTYVTAYNEFEVSKIYVLALLLGMALAIQKEKDAMMIQTRNALVGFVVFSFAMSAIKFNTVWDISYDQGLVPGLPRFYGLAPHAIIMGSVCGLGALLLLTYPVKNPVLQKSLLGLLIFCLFATQAKANMASFFMGFMLYLLYSKAAKEAEAHTGQSSLGLFFMGIMVILIFIIAAIFSIDWMAVMRGSLNSEQIESITTVTGRTKIWEVALNEYYKNPWFGYGANLFSVEFRESVGMPFAVDSHNMFVDAISRGGLVGLSGYILLYIYLGFQAFRFGIATRGLSVSLFMMLFITSITEVPISWSALGINGVNFYLLILIVSVNLIPKEREQTTSLVETKSPKDPDSDASSKPDQQMSTNLKPVNPP